MSLYKALKGRHRVLDWLSKWLCSACIRLKGFHGVLYKKTLNMQALN